MTQPALGLLSSAIVMAIALGFVSLFDFGTFAGWVAFVMLGLIPMQVVAVVLWGANPAFASGLRQPVKGIVLVLVTLVATAVISPLVFMTVGEGMAPPGPIPSHYVVIVVPTTFWLAIMMGGWPFNRISSNPLVVGVAALIGAYVITYVVFRIFFNYDFMQGAPVYLQSAPKGMFNGVSALVFYVTALAVMFLVLCFDLWPLTKFPAVMKQPVLGVVWTVIALAGAALAFSIGVTRSRGRPDGLPDTGHRALHLRVDHRSQHASELALCADDAAAQGRDEYDRRGGDRPHPRQPVRVVDPHGDRSACLGPAGIRAGDLARQCALERDVSVPHLSRCVLRLLAARPRDATSGSEQAAAV